MEILGTQIILATKQTVWDGLNNPEVLKKCPPGCESVELVSPNVFKVLITASIGPLKAKFNGTLQVTEINSPSSCVLVFEGQGGAVGFGKGSSSVSLKEVEGGTELSYAAQAHVGGKLAQIGSRLIDSVAKKMSDDFFKAFNQEVGVQIIPTSETTTLNLNQVTPLNQSLGVSDLDNQMSTKLSPSGLPQQVPAFWLIIAAGVGATIVIVAELILK